MEPGSFLAWLDYSEGQRRKAMDLIDAFRQKDSRDELGLGGIRDAFAEVLFPGTGTVQTRARYFLFVPWIYRRLQEKGVAPAEIAQRARAAELSLIKALVDAGERDGVIGIERRDRLKRLPSNIYWLGLEKWGIRRVHGSQEDFHRAWKRLIAAPEAARNDDGEVLGGSAAGPWHSKLPPPPPGFPQKAAFALRSEEARFLREQITTHHPRTLLAFLVDRGVKWEPVNFPWQHPQVGEVPLHIREEIAEAQAFSEVVHGAAILYNLMLAEKRSAAHSGKSSEAKDLVRYYGGELKAWARGTSLALVPVGWPTERFWSIAQRGNPRISARTREFVSIWAGHARQVRSGSAPDTPTVRHLILARELAIKGTKQARLHDAAALARWNEAAGMGQMKFRWNRAQRILLDVLEGGGSA